MSFGVLLTRSILSFVLDNFDYSFLHPISLFFQSSFICLLFSGSPLNVFIYQWHTYLFYFLVQLYNFFLIFFPHSNGILGGKPGIHDGPGQVLNKELLLESVMKLLEMSFPPVYHNMISM